MSPGSNFKQKQSHVSPESYIPYLRCLIAFDLVMLPLIESFFETALNYVQIDDVESGTLGGPSLNGDKGTSWKSIRVAMRPKSNLLINLASSGEDSLYPSLSWSISKVKISWKSFCTPATKTYGLATRNCSNKSEGSAKAKRPMAISPNKALTCLTSLHSGDNTRT